MIHAHPDVLHKIDEELHLLDLAFDVATIAAKEMIVKANAKREDGRNRLIADVQREMAEQAKSAQAAAGAAHDHNN